MVAAAVRAPGRRGFARRQRLRWESRRPGKAPRRATHIDFDIGAGTPPPLARARSASPSASGCAATTWASSALVLAPHESMRAMSEADVLARDIVDEICVFLWYRSFRTICEEFRNQSRDFADIEGACRNDCSPTRHTIAVPADSTAATVVRSSASSR